MSVYRCSCSLLYVREHLVNISSRVLMLRRETESLALLAHATRRLPSECRLQRFPDPRRKRHVTQLGNPLDLSIIRIFQSYL